MAAEQTYFHFANYDSNFVNFDNILVVSHFVSTIFQTHLAVSDHFFYGRLCCLRINLARNLHIDFSFYKNATMVFKRFVYWDNVSGTA